MATMTADEYYRLSSERSGKPVPEMVEAGYRAYKCNCGERGCVGWVMLDSGMVEGMRGAAGIKVTIQGTELDPFDHGYVPTVAAGA